MTTIGYARVSATDQNAEAQQKLLEKNGADRIFIEKMSGRTLDRPELEGMLSWGLNTGDTLLITRLDRLGRDTHDLLTLMKRLDERGVFLKATEQDIDTSTATGKLLVQMLAIVSEFEVNLKKERQAEGIANAKANGVYKGRQRSIDRDKFKQMLGEGKKVKEIMAEMKISRSAYYKVRDELGL